MQKKCNCPSCNCSKGYQSGTCQEQGTYECKNCGQKVYLDSEKKLPNCPKCGGDVFTRS